MILVSVVEIAPAALIADLGAGALLRLERSVSEGGVYAEFATVALDTDVTVYDVWDPSGDETTWYRHRFSAADGEDPTDYGDPFQAGAPVYASRTDLLGTIRQAVTDVRFLDRCTTVLAEVTRDLTREVGYSFFRQPTSGTEDVTFDGTGKSLLHVHGNAPRVGVLSIGTLEIRHRVTDDWIEIPADEFRLESAPGATGREPGDPYFHVRLLSHASYRAFPRGTDTVRASEAVFGWAAVPTDAREATVAWARQKLAGDPALPGGPMGPDEYGQPVGPDRWPRAVYDLVTRERTRHECWR